MSKFNLIYDYKNNDNHRLSFNQLAKSVFGIDFEPWYQKGFWNDRYVCYSILDGSKVVSNISISKMDIVWEGQRKSVLQIGTVMTHPEYRKRGLSARLMNTILEEYEKKYDFIYLFANETVYNFYPKFGFEELKEYQFSSDIDICPAKPGKIRKLDISNEKDLEIILRLSSERKPISKVLGVTNDQALLLFYCMYVFAEDTYYLEEEDLVILFKQQEDKLHIYDLICNKEVNFKDILNKIASVENTRVHFHFTPDFKDINVNCSVYTPDYKLFIKPIPENITNKFVFPTTSHA